MIIIIIGIRWLKNVQFFSHSCSPSPFDDFYRSDSYNYIQHCSISNNSKFKTLTLWHTIHVIFSVKSENFMVLLVDTIIWWIYRYSWHPSSTQQLWGWFFPCLVTVQRRNFLKKKTTCLSAENINETFIALEVQGDSRT